MLRTPSRRFTRRPAPGLNLIPILDAVFIFIFFLLMSTNFVQIFEISSDVPIISSTPPSDKDKDPLMLNLKIEKDQIVILTGLSPSIFKVFKRNAKGLYPLEEIHLALIDIKKKNLSERQIILEPTFDIIYEELISIMDTSRMLRNTDPTLTFKDKDTLEDIKITEPFDQVLFGNIQGELE